MTRRPYDWGDALPRPAVLQIRYWAFLAGWALVFFVLVTLALRVRGR